MTQNTSWAIPNLIQGVSQQAAQQRRDSQCEEQFDCLNSPKDGAVSRHGFNLMKSLALDLRGAYCFEIGRSSTEHYLVTVKAGTVRAYNLASGGTDCTVTVAGTYNGYLASASKGFSKQTAGDFSFIAARAVKPAMLPTLSGTRPKEALINFKAGAYLNKYTISVLFAGTVYRYSYTTPDNSVAGNALYINTTQIAGTFYRAMSGSIATTNSYGVGAVFGGETGGGGIGTPSILQADPTTLTSLGFSLEINGSLIRLWREDGQDFTVDISDSQGGTALVALKDNIQSFAELPRGGFEGMLFRVRPKGAEAGKSDYYVEFVSKTAVSGFWRERVAPGVKYLLDPDTMPHAIVNTGLNTFEVRRLTWSSRIAGDGVDTAKDPGFVGKEIKKLLYHKGRLGVLTESTVDWSKARNPYTFFPDTAQTVLASDPIGIEISGVDSSAVLSQTSQVDDVLMLWAQQAQFRITSGQDPFRQDTVEADPSTAYEFAEDVDFARVGSSLYFVTEPDMHANVRNLQFQGGKPLGDVDVSDHVSDYIPAGSTRLSITDTGKMLTLQTAGAPSSLFVYNFLTQSNAYVQSAWHTWRLPEGEIIWHSIYRMRLYVLMYREIDGKTFLLETPLRASAVDPGLAFTLRLDLRVTEAALTGKAYSSSTDVTTMELPYRLSAGERTKFRLALRSVFGDKAPAYLLEASVGSNGTTVTVPGDVRSAEFYAGLAISSERLESEFFLRGARGEVPVDDLTVDFFKVSHANSGYYRIELDQGRGRARSVELSTRDLSSPIDLLAPPALTTGSLGATVGVSSKQCRIRIVNDSVLPSRWQSAEYIYRAVTRAAPSRIRTSQE